MFDSTRYYFTPGVGSADTATIRDAAGNPVLHYRGFASIVGIVAALVLSIVLVAGLAATLFLFAEERSGAAVAAAILSLAFAALIAALIPRTRVTLYSEQDPALRIVQRSRFSFPSSTWAVRTPEGETLALLSKSMLTRLTTNRWWIAAPPEQRGSAYAVEESVGRAITRKLVGKFRRKFEADMHVVANGVLAARIVRRPDEKAEADYLEINAGTGLDRRVAIALATLVFGIEP